MLMAVITTTTGNIVASDVFVFVSMIENINKPNIVINTDTIMPLNM